MRKRIVRHTTAKTHAHKHVHARSSAPSAKQMAARKRFARAARRGKIRKGSKL